MKALYFDCFAGISGDMILGALVDSGVDINDLENELSKLPLDGWTIESEKVMKNGITGTKINIIIEEQKAHRHLKDIEKIIDDASLDEFIKSKSKLIFRRLAEAEAKIHNTTPEKIHFHEVGALDAIIDIVGTVIGIKLLDIEKVYASRIHVGTGFVECAHGKIPVPAPATIELLKNIPVYATGIQNEITTPTGAAIISSLADNFGDMPLMQINHVGYGAGTRQLEIPNLLRVLVGEISEGAYEEDTIILAETNIDDMNPEFYQYITDKLFKAGALDVYIVPIQMKKDRPGVTLSFLSPPEKLDYLCDALFTETTTFGVRTQQLQRKKLRREIKTVATRYGDIQVKIGYLKNKPIKAVPEYERCRQLAEKHNIPIGDVYEEVKNKARHFLK